jgi:membrane-bound metal-dependent hydrolase YbcI (DUF457 family)
MNVKTHQIVASLAIGGFLTYKEYQAGEQSLKPFAGAALAAWATTLPDILEPADHPNHRQFCHSLTFATMLGCTLIELNAWQARTDFEKALKFSLLVMMNAYLVHLALDFTTTKSLPLIGKLN